MSNVIKKIRQLENAVTYNIGNKVCPNCYFLMADTVIVSGQYICPCCEYSPSEYREEE
ncbi:hypothetical protein [Vibrio algarum]|uniref:Uncharacterized protein n=1 Tax=Vibrio algarum TaxID=3020714 RepID=A0ABT4YUC6_9VIBR|nr:hypothetical protein [Vibrio sp. KJ40-1]MDB1125187.1 hypothetical protein [Vibrio sp. KJ40-1]